MVRKIDWKTFIKDHKEGFIAVAIMIATIAVEKCLSVSNETELESDFDDSDYIDCSDEETDLDMIDVSEDNLFDEQLVTVNQHFRNLLKGWKASPEKSALAEELGIELGENQTWVDEYQKKM